MNFNSKEIMPHKTIYKIVADYSEAVKRVTAAYELLSQAEKLMKSITEYSYVLPDRRSLYDGDTVRVLNGLKSKAWEGILEKTQAHKIMTISRYQTFLKSLEKPNELPPINVETVSDFIKNLISSVPDMLLDFVKETFDWLHPGQWGVRQYKTNAKSKYELKSKIIKTYVFENGYESNVHLNHRSKQPLSAMDNAFHLLDGKSIFKHESSLLSAILIATQEGKKSAETEYFKMPLCFCKRRKVVDVELRFTKRVSIFSIRLE